MIYEFTNGPDCYRSDKSVKFGIELPLHLLTNTGGGAHHKRFWYRVKGVFKFHPSGENGIPVVGM